MISIVIPVHDEEDNVQELQRRLATVLDELDEPTEVIVVDDGSRDATYPLLVGLNMLDPRF
jgi:glycosyltransferase involved in cell wall biosynthesis